MSAAEAVAATDNTASVIDMTDAWSIDDLESLLAPNPVKDFIRGFLRGLFGVPA